MSAITIKVQKPRSFFWGQVSVDEDIERHRKKELELRDKIAKYEAIENRTKMEERALSTYQGFLRQLMQSKELVANKIGRNK